MQSHRLLALVLLFVPIFARGDYLDLKHATSLKAEPRSGSATIVELASQTKVILVQDQQKNGYYHVKVPDTGQEGWVYRTMGRRYAGDPELSAKEASLTSAGSNPPSENASEVLTPHTWGAPTKSSGCHSQNGLPDPGCTPGDIVLGSTEDQICSATFHTATRRNKTTSQSQKNLVYPMYGIIHPEHNTGSNQVCEIDHLVPLELAGADTMANVWSQCSPGYGNWQGPGYKDKDGFENYLWFHVCVNQDITLHDAQIEMATNWRKYWELAGKPDCHNREKCE